MGGKNASGEAIMAGGLDSTTDNGAENLSLSFTISAAAHKAGIQRNNDAIGSVNHTSPQNMLQFP